MKYYCENGHLLLDTANQVCAVCAEAEVAPSRSPGERWECVQCPTKFADENSVQAHSVETGHAYRGAGAGPSEREALGDLVIDICRETYDRFVMGGWEPQDAHGMIREMLQARAAVPQTAPLYQEMLDELEDVYEFAVVEKVALGEPEIESIRNLISRARAAAVPAPATQGMTKSPCEPGCKCGATPKEG